MFRLLLQWAISAAGVWAAVRFVPGIRIEEGLGPLFAVALILGAVNALVKPILSLLACGIIVVTLGLFLLVINAGMLLLAGGIARTIGIDFFVDGFLPALLGALVISAVSWLGSMLVSKPSESSER